MNKSGDAVQAIMNFYKIPLEHVLVVHDDLDLNIGVIRLRSQGGHGGHNGLRDIIARLGTKDFCRLRIGIGHPGHKSEVTDYVLKKAPKHEQHLIEEAMDEALRIMPSLLEGNIQNAMQTLHTEPQREKTTDGI